ncbi:CRE-DCT-18 protein [Ditylenchus destructor]|nr:CRE-DCT-18 protein [Ditylenchus destructor]
MTLIQFLLLLSGAILTTQVGFSAGADECVDQVNNVITMENVGDNPINFNNGTIGTYNTTGSPTCYKSEANLYLPGQIALLTGNITVTTAMKIVNNSKLLLSVKKKSWVVGKVCENGKSKKSALVSDDDCSPDLCKYELGLCQMLEKPGTYNIADLQAVANISNIIDLPSPPSGAKTVMKGRWKMTVELQVGGNQTAFKVNIPPGDGWLYIEE